MVLSVSTSVTLSETIFLLELSTLLNRGNKIHSALFKVGLTVKYIIALEVLYKMQCGIQSQDYCVKV